jgi:tetratricopeptide (TPR) repeat protein
LGRRDEAIAELERVVQGQPRRVDPYLSLGTAYLEAERFDDALRVEPSARPLDQARIFRKLGSSYWRQHAHAHARQQLTLAEATLGSPLADAPPGVFGEHIEIQLGKFEQLYFSQEETAVAHALLAALEATIDQHGSPGQRARYYLCAASNTMAKARFAYSEAALAYARKGAAVDVDQLTLREEALAQFIVGFALMLGERPAREEALQWFDRAASGAARSGDRTLGSRVATYRALTHLRQGEVAAARDAAEHALELAEAAKIAIYAAAAHACAAWVHWRTPGDDRALVLGRAEEAQRRWHDKPASFPFRWCLNFVLLDLAQQEQRCAALLGPLEQLLEPLQQVLPEALESALRQALSACREDRLAEATVATDEALRLARRGGFC